MYKDLGIERIIDSGVKSRDGVLLSDYLKVVEEKERVEQRLDNSLDANNVNYDRVKELEKELKEKYDQIKIIEGISKADCLIIVNLEDKLKEKDERIERHLKDLETLGKICNEQRIELKEKEEEIRRLKINYKDLTDLNNWNVEHLNSVIEGKQRTIDYLNEFIKKEGKEVEETWTLSYSYYDRNGDIKQYRQSGLLKDEYEEMYGMDSDNWISHSLVKDRKGDK